MVRCALARLKKGMGGAGISEFAQLPRCVGRGLRARRTPAVIVRTGGRERFADLPASFAA